MHLSIPVVVLGHSCDLAIIRHKFHKNYWSCLSKNRMRIVYKIITRMWQVNGFHLSIYLILWGLHFPLYFTSAMSMMHASWKQFWNIAVESIWGKRFLAQVWENLFELYIHFCDNVEEFFFYAINSGLCASKYGYAAWNSTDVLYLQIQSSISACILYIFNLSHSFLIFITNYSVRMCSVCFSLLAHTTKY